MHDREADFEASGSSHRSLPVRLSTKAECECVAHMLQSLTDLNPEVTVTSIDGVGAYDLISRSAMLEGLLRMEGGDQIFPFVRMFYSNPSTCLWEDELGMGGRGARRSPHAHALRSGPASGPSPSPSKVVWR